MAFAEGQALIAEQLAFVQAAMQMQSGTHGLCQMQTDGRIPGGMNRLPPLRLAV